MTAAQPTPSALAEIERRLMAAVAERDQATPAHAESEPRAVR